MFNLSEYRKNPDRLADLLPWAALIAPGIVLNKDGSFQRTIRFRGPDLESATEPQLVAAMARLNNALKRFSSGWALYVEAKRDAYAPYPEKSHFKDPISLMVDTERKEQFAKEGENFESEYYITLQFLPPSETTSKLNKLVFQDNTNNKINYRRSLEFFIAGTQRFLDILKDIMFEADFLNDEEVLTYLHSTVSPKHHPVKPPETPMYIDSLLADSPLVTGLAPMLGDTHIRTISILSFPSFTMPALLDQLNQLPMKYRWVTRFIPLDKGEAESQLKSYKRRWFAKRKGMLQLLQEVFTKAESPLMDTAAMEKARDVDSALQELGEDYVIFGYYTATITVQDKDLEKVNEMQREIERVINGLGFTTASETFNAVEAWLSSLPGQAYSNIRMPLLHSLNLAHLIPFSSIWPGPSRDAHLDGPPWMYVQTHGRTPFRLVNHIGDVGHTMMIGPTGAGKSVMLTMSALQFLRYKNSQVFVFDKGGGFLASTLGVGGGYYEPGVTSASLTFQPLANIDQEREKVWAAEWVLGLLVNEQVNITPEIKQSVWEALKGLSQVPQEQRTLTGLKALLQNNELRQALSTYSMDGPFGHLLDADSEINRDEAWQCYEMEELMATPSVIAPVLSYLFHKLESKFTGAPTLLILDEAWLFLDHPMFAAKIRDWLKSLRKQNVSVVFATQSIEDAINSTIAPTLLESCPARILLPNDRVLEPQIRASYEKLGLNEKQLHILATSIPKRQYYYQSRLGNRLFDLEVGPIGLAFCAASSKTTQKVIKNIVEQHDPKEFLRYYLEYQNLTWVWDFLNKKEQPK